MATAFQAYLDSITELSRRGDASEESYYPALKTLLEALAREQGRAVQVTVVPKTTEAGNPDFRVWDGSHQVIGYIEAKAPGTTLDVVETSDQLQRYLHTFPNVILTDFYEFRLYRDGVLMHRALLARPVLAQRLKVRPPAEGVEALKQLFEAFFSFALPPALTAEALSRELARRTRFLRDEVIRPELEQKQKDIYGFYEAFRKYLIAGLTEEQFADLYAQTITYGLFAARTRARETFNRQTAYSLIPSTIGILRDVFQFISLGKPSKQMEVIVDDIAGVLNAADVQAILTQYYQQGRGDDPVLHFYETFLAEYDPETRERRGVYYTPEPVVRYIVRAVHHLLQTRFGLADGLADAHVTLLDPAAGTLTFPAEAIRTAFAAYTGKYGEGGKSVFLRSHILPHFYAFELLMAPYAIGHMKVGFLLEALGVPLQNGERFQFYLTNTLEMEDLEQIAIPGLSSLSEESHCAARVKKEEPILVILGNPPYSGISANQNEWTERLLKEDVDGAQSYYTVDGRPLGEKNPKWLQDDYVKFLRFAQWKIHKAGRGIVAMITNHGYLDNPTFRGMRQSLLKTFDEIYILDLHGNSLKRETAPDGGPDENVFDIRQGVAIGLFVKYGENAVPRPHPPSPPAEKELPHPHTPSPQTGRELPHPRTPSPFAGSEAPHPHTPSPLEGRGLGGGVEAPHPRNPALPMEIGHPRPRTLHAAEGGGYRWQTEAVLWHHLKPAVREMRKHPTPAEEALWERLRRRQLGIRFRRQHCIDRFIVDFYARDAGLIVEVDGPIHQAQREYDAWRQSVLEELGYRVLRFTNEQVLEDIEGVLECIQGAIPRSRTPSPLAGSEAPHPRTPSPSAERELPHPRTPSPSAERGLGGGVETPHLHNPAPSMGSEHPHLYTSATSESPGSELPHPHTPSPSAGRGLGGGVYHAHLYGTRAHKYTWLDSHDLSTTPWQRLTPQSPHYFFTPRQTQNIAAYQSWPSVVEIFPVNSVGIVTARDGFAIAFDKTELQNRILQFQNLQGLPDEVLAQAYNLKDKPGWSLAGARKKVHADANAQRKVYPILYRPFDVRYIFYHDAVIERPRPEVMRHMLAGKNLALMTCRQLSQSSWQHAMISDRLTDDCMVSNRTRERGYLFPLYLYPSAQSPDMFHQVRRPNLADGLLPKLAAAYGFEPTPEDVLAYIYAVLYSPTYRQKYAQELRTDFPRLPFTADGHLFQQMAGLGRRLIALHLLDSPELDPPLVKYHGQGSDIIEKVRYDGQRRRVYINADKYFEGITPEMWGYSIGGYQVLAKYLKDRKGRRMDDPVRYIHIATAIARTMELQEQIDQLYPQVEEAVVPLGRGAPAVPPQS